MIQLLDNGVSLKSFTDICGIKLQSLAISYGFECSFCTFWSQINDEGEVTAVIGKFGSAVTVTHGDADLQELADFIGFIGFGELVCSQSLACFFSRYNWKTINEVQKHLNSKGKSHKELTYLEYEQIYNIMKSAETEAINLGNFEDWYVDLSHRVRHGGAVAVLTEQGCGVALLADGVCIINGITVVAKHRGTGYGRMILEGLETTKDTTRALAFCLDSELPFYQKCGYNSTEKYILISKGK